MTDSATLQRLERPGNGRLRIAVVGSGISGLSAAWLLAKNHEVTLFEADDRLGGHSHTVEAGGIPVDTGFIVYNEITYPNLAALFDHLGVETQASTMSFAVSLDEGRLEYSGTGLGGLFAQPGNLARPRFWRMLRELLRFYREAPRELPAMGEQSLGTYLESRGYGEAFCDDHLYPMAAAIWSTPAADVGRYPAAAFVRFCDNHGLLKLAGRPIWRTVKGGSRSYVRRILDDFPGTVLAGHRVRAVTRAGGSVDVVDGHGVTRRFDHVVLAAHADQALRMLSDASRAEREVLGAFSYTANEAVLHCDPSLMPLRRKVWSSWNYLSRDTGDARNLSVTYWMNRLQDIRPDFPLFVTLNPLREPKPGSVFMRQTCHHPAFDTDAMRMQKRLWSLQGTGNIWFCGAYFGSGFHEDGLQSGLAVAEALGGAKRPWSVAGESGRIFLPRPPRGERELEAA